MKKPNLVSLIAIIVIVLVGAFLAFNLNKKPQLKFTAVKQGSLTQGVNLDGTVQAAQDLSLAFEQGGTVTEVDVQAGQQVKAGQVLVRLNNKDAAATVNQASAALAQAQAAYQKLQAGATSASVDVSQAAVQTAQTNLDNAKKNLTAVTSQQQLLVKNAFTTLLNSNLAAIPATSNISTASPTITGAYSGTQQGSYTIKIYSSGSGPLFNYTGLESGSGQVSTAPVALGTLGLFVQFSSLSVNSGDSWTINLPNTQGTSYVSNYNTYQAALQTQNQALTQAQAQIDSATSALAQAQASLNLTQTPARPEDLAAAQAAVQAAQANLQTAENNYGKSVITAPIDGTITSVDTKVGQTVAGSTIAPGPAAIKMISASQFQFITYVSQADLGKIKIGDNASISLESYANTSFPAAIISIDPSATVTNGVPTYKTTLQFVQNDDRIKEGLDGNAVINDENKDNILYIPQSAVIKNGNQEFVLVSDSKGHITQTPILTGISDLNGNVEVTSGLNPGQQIATFGK